MEVLQRMRVIWPSAWRALELLHGAKAQLERPTADAPPSRGPIPSPRNKRSAEEPIEEEVEEVPERSRSTVSQDSVVYRQPASYPVATSPGQSQGPASHAPASQGYALPMDLPQGGPSSYMPPSYDRWAADTSALSNFSGSLSTSVLPQQYSTGLVDERMGSSLGRSAERQSARYPQYWNDYSALGQMETTYGVPVMGEMVSPHGGAQQGDAPSMYVPDQYSMFGESSAAAFLARRRLLTMHGRAGNMPPSSQQ